MEYLEWNANGPVDQRRYVVPNRKRPGRAVTVARSQAPVVFPHPCAAFGDSSDKGEKSQFRPMGKCKWPLD